jgi:hypothetical protein
MVRIRSDEILRLRDRIHFLASLHNPSLTSSSSSSSSPSSLQLNVIVTRVSQSDWEVCDDHLTDFEKFEYFQMILSEIFNYFFLLSFWSGGEIPSSHTKCTSACLQVNPSHFMEYIALIFLSSFL